MDANTSTMPPQSCRAVDAITQLGVAWNPEDERTPVLAIGSNAGPEQLLRKYPPEMFPEGVLIPCVRCMLKDFDVAFAPLISSYGSCTGESSIGIRQQKS